MSIFRVPIIVSALLLSFAPGAVFGAADSATSATNISGIAHVAIRTTDLQKSLAFYQSLGFVRAFEFTRDSRPSEEFLKINDRQFLELYPAKQGDKAGFMHICFESDDLTALDDQLNARGLKAPPVQKAGAGNLLFSIHGPNGAIIEFTQYMPDSMHSRDRGQHLGAQRISDELIGVTMPVQDAAAYRSLFAGQLGFAAVRREPQRLRVPGPARATVSFLSTSENPAHLLFAVQSLSRTSADLRARSITFHPIRNGIQISDPDGNMIEFLGEKR
jgi:catechol 2,3-dioxygenase-like lactoylglutathione lyase family enzyme